MAQLELLTSNYEKLEESHESYVANENLLVSHARLKLVHEAITTKVTSCEPHVGTSTTSQNSILYVLVLVILHLMLLLNLVMNYSPCLVVLTMKPLLPLVLVLSLTM
jgi:hypothetical protein